MNSRIVYAVAIIAFLFCFVNAESADGKQTPELDAILPHIASSTYDEVKAKHWMKSLDKVKRLRSIYQRRLEDVRSENDILRKRENQIHDRVLRVHDNNIKLTRQVARIERMALELKLKKKESQRVAREVGEANQVLQEISERFQNLIGAISEMKNASVARTRLSAQKEAYLVKLNQRITTLHNTILERTKVDYSKKADLRRVEEELALLEEQKPKEERRLAEETQLLAKIRDREVLVKKEIDSLNAQILDRRNRLNKVTASLRDIDRESTTAAAELERLRKEDEALTADLSARQKKGDEIQRKADDSSEAANDASSRLEGYKRDQTAQLLKIVDKNVSVNALSEDVADASRTAGNINQQVDKMNARLDTLKAKAADAKSLYDLALQSQEEQRGKRNFLTNEWVDWGRGFGGARWFRFRDICVVSGTVVYGKEPWGVIGHLPEKCRPNARLIFGVLFSELYYTRFDLLANGEIQFNAGPQWRSWISLGGMSFTVGDGGKALSLSGQWSNYPDTQFRGATYYHADGICSLGGLVSPQNAGYPVGTLPAECQPSGRLLFLTNNHYYRIRTDITTDGNVYYIWGMGHAWMSLSGIIFAKKPTAVSTQGSWSNYLNTYQVVSYSAVDNLCVVGGLVSTSTHIPHYYNWNLDNAVTLLPSNCRPGARLIFNTIRDWGLSARIDVNTDGRVGFVVSQNVMSPGSWLSLDGIAFQI